MIEGLTTRGNQAVEAGLFAEAVKCYTEALDIDPSGPLQYNNRSVAYIRLHDYKAALADAEKVIELRPGWAKVRHLLCS